MGRAPQLNPATVKLARKFAEESEGTIDLLHCVGWDGDIRKLRMALCDLTMKQIIRIQTYAANIHAAALHERQIPDCPQYIQRILQGWHP